MSVLKIKNGKFITIRRFQSKMLLCAVEIQDEQENGTTWTRNGCVKQAFWHIQLWFTYLLSKNVAFSVVAPLVHIQRQGTSRAFKFYYDHNWYWMKVVGNRLQVNLPLIYWWDHLWVFVLPFLKLWLNLTVRKGWRQRPRAFLVWEGRPEKQRTLRPAIHASVYHLVPLHKAQKPTRSFNLYEEAWGLRPNQRREERLAIFFLILRSFTFFLTAVSLSCL